MSGYSFCLKRANYGIYETAAACPSQMVPGLLTCFRAGSGKWEAAVAALVTGSISAQACARVYAGLGQKQWVEVNLALYELSCDSACAPMLP
jgi:hypothetical protein